MASFDEFFDEHYDEVVRTLTLAVGDRPRAEDAAQEAFARAFRKWASVSRMERPVGWVIVVGMNQMRRWAARIDRRERDHASTAGAAGHAGDPADAVVDAATLRAALDRLGPRQRATVVLRILCDLSTDEVARALGCSSGTVKSALHAALANLRLDLDDLDAFTEPTLAAAPPIGAAPNDPITTSGKEAPRHA